MLLFNKNKLLEMSGFLFIWFDPLLPSFIYEFYYLLLHFSLTPVCIHAHMPGIIYELSIHYMSWPMPPIFKSMIPYWIVMSYLSMYVYIV